MLVFSSCSNKVSPIFFMTKNQVKPVNTELKDINLLVNVISDERKFESSKVLNGKKKTVYHKGELHCINPNGKYRNDFFYYLSLFGKKYLHAYSAVRLVSNNSYEYDYELKWSIANYEILQKYSKEASKARDKEIYLSAAFGLLGASIAASTNDSYFKSFAKVKILFNSIELFDNKGELIHTFTNIERTLEDDLIADADCECAYYNIDLQFKYFIKDLIPELEDAIINDLK